MKKKIALVLAGLMTMGLMGCGNAAQAPATESAPAQTETKAEEQAEAPAETAEAPAESDGMDALIEAAKAEGELIVYGSCEEEYLAAACEHFQELYGIKVQYQRLSTGEVQSKIEEEKGNPSGDVWFGGTTDPEGKSFR